MNNNIDMNTFKQIIKAGVIIGQANPNKNVNELIDTVAGLMIKKFIRNITDEK